MREFKFKAWNDNFKRMSKPFGLESDVCDFTNKKGLGHVKSLTDEIIMQYTGLKDKNGIEIYEGDILQGRGDFKYKVVWDVCEFICYHLYIDNRWGRLSRLNDLDMSDIFSNIEVIGNIYENNDLIK